MARLSDEEIEQALQGGDWVREGDAITREWEHRDFASAMAFVNQVGEMAEGANRHPDILLHSWNKVRLTLTTHSEGGLTQGDIDMARGLDGLTPP